MTAHDFEAEARAWIRMINLSREDMPGPLAALLAANDARARAEAVAEDVREMAIKLREARELGKADGYRRGVEAAHQWLDDGERALCIPENERVADTMRDAAFAIEANRVALLPPEPAKAGCAFCGNPRCFASMYRSAMRPTIEELRAWIRYQTEYDCGNERQIREAWLAALDVAEADQEWRWRTGSYRAMCNAAARFRATIAPSGGKVET